MRRRRNGREKKQRKKLTRAEAEALDHLMRVMKRFGMSEWFKDLKKRSRRLRRKPKESLR